MKNCKNCQGIMNYLNEELIEIDNKMDNVKERSIAIGFKKYGNYRPYRELMYKKKIIKQILEMIE